jgi:hypothetical protein
VVREISRKFRGFHTDSTRFEFDGPNFDTWDNNTLFVGTKGIWDYDEPVNIDVDLEGEIKIVQLLSMSVMNDVDLGIEVYREWRTADYAFSRRF